MAAQRRASPVRSRCARGSVRAAVSLAATALGDFAAMDPEDVPFQRFGVGR